MTVDTSDIMNTTTVYHGQTKGEAMDGIIKARVTLLGGIAQCLLREQDLRESERVITPKDLTLTSRKVFRKIVEQARIMAVTY